MADLFIKILNMSISAGWLILLVVFLRLLFRKMPKWIMVLLWGIVGLRLLLPVSLESRLSLIPSAETISVDESGVNTRLQTGIDVIDRLAVSEETTQDKTEIHAGTGEVISSNAGSNASDVSPTVADRKTSRDLFHILGMIWLAGDAVMLVYASFSFLRLKLRVRESIPVDGTKKGRIRICDRIETPFILGTFLPVIYLPSGLGEYEQDHVIAHEKAHLSRRDHLWKPLGYLLLTVYWFNPLIWAAYILLCRDIEMACDEKVIRGMEAAGRKAYATTLVSCSLHQREVMVCPLAFGEVGVKERVKGILSYKRPAFWVILLSVAACIVVGVLFLTNPAKDTEETDTETNHFVYEGVYYYSGNKKETHGSGSRRIDLLVQIKEDGSFFLSELPDDSIIGSGKYTVDGDMLTLTGSKKVGETEEKQVVYHFRADGENLIYVADNSSGFDVAQVQDGEVFQKGHNPYDDYREKCYFYTQNGKIGENGLPIFFFIDLMPDGGCLWIDSQLRSSVPESVYTIDGDILTITSTTQVLNDEIKEVNRFQIKENALYFIAEGSSNFWIKLNDGDEFAGGPDPMTDKFRELEEAAFTGKSKEKEIDPDAAWRGEGINLFGLAHTDPQIYDKEIPQLGLSMKLMDVSLECCTTVFSNYGNEETGDIEIDTGEAWYLQKKVDGKWTRVRSNYETGVVEVGYSIPKGEVSRKMLDQWVALVGRLTPGEYRIMKFVTTNRQVGGYRGFYIAQSFNVEENGSIYGDYYLENEDPFSSAASSSIDTFREYDNDGNLIVVKFGRNQKTVEIDYGSSVLYTKDEMSPLIEQIVNVLMFRAKNGLEVYAIRFTSDEECSKYDELKMLNEQGRTKTGNPKLTYKEYIKFETDTKEPDDPQKSSEPGVKHTGWGWWFAREEGGEWVLVGQGY